MIKKLLLRTFLIGGLVLGQLSFLIWLINYLYINTTSNHAQNIQQESLISNAHAESQMLAYAVPLVSPPQPQFPKIKPSQHRTGVSNLQIKQLDKSRVSLSFPDENYQISDEERDLLEQYLAYFQVNRGHYVRVYVETATTTPEENLVTRPVPKLRAQTVARVIYPYTQNVEIVFTSHQLQAGSLIIDVNSPAYHEKS
jgi:hypothetical protein